MSLNAHADILRYTAFSKDPAGGNPAGVVLDATGLTDAEMLAIAAGLGYSESAFLYPDHTLRFFSPKAEVAFCGHATVATAVALAQHRGGPGDYVFKTPAGEIPVSTEEVDGEIRATLTSVEPHIKDVDEADLTEALAALGWPAGDLDPALPPRIAFAGNNHLIVSAATRERLADLSYDFERLKALMERLGLTTVQLVHRAGETLFHVRDPFPIGGVVEDAATGAAAVAFGAYARELALVKEESVLTLHQGEDMGRPSRLTVTLRAGDPRVRVAGTAVPID
ncbi:PhzF family phenazine biosynthesis protein [Streptomyces sp. YC504]|uniref:PhzF family phenazine biosynthesis protein n=1 Tax=Streptomyces mesophilus TaxID=1775132 RepID=A0A6G4XU93_9ACTN|nr:PhzF family phenazine biosynthesis isomerase [Streptomyces mesophilus]NGO80264.1 PhzF family phenazine biosynthesis protein [Streptomyces mesophilus]